MTKASQLLATVSDLGREFDKRVRQYTLTVCLFPPKPLHIHQKQAAIASFRHYLSCKRLGLIGQREQNRRFNEAIRATNDAIFYHRLQVSKNTAGQTFGGAI
nr:hypothetical protein [uncultured Rhodoferax sp.]